MELYKGTLDVLLLKTLSWGPLHGYGVARAIRLQTHDELAVEEGALYPALRRLEAKGWLEAEWGTTDTGRDAKFYRLTDQGGEELDRQTRSWGRYVEAMAQVLGATSAPEG